MKTEIREKYRCTECGRGKELEINTQGLTVFGRCTITKNCRGQLYRETGLNSKKTFNERNQGDVEDWEQSKLLYIHTQDTPSNDWLVTHNMNSIPTICVYDTDGGEINDYIIQTNTTNELEIRLPDPMEGIVHCIKREESNMTVTRRDIDSERGDEMFKYVDRIPLAIKFGHVGEANESDTVELELEFIQLVGIGGVVKKITLDANRPSEQSAWGGDSLVALFGNRSNIFRIFWLEIPAEFSTGGYSFIIKSGLPLDEALLLLEDDGGKVLGNKLSLETNENRKKFELGRDFVMTIGTGLERVRPPIRVVK